MKNINVGIANLIISNKLKSSYFKNELIEESKKLISCFFDVIKNSPILQLEFKIFNNLENKHIENDLIATRYIDNNIKLFEVYTINELNKEHEKLNSFIIDDDVHFDDKRVGLYNAINSLVEESLKDYDDVDIDKIHESFIFVLNHIKEPKKTAIETTNLINEGVVEIAVNKFNKKYELLDDDDKELFQKLVSSNNEEKQNLLENYKTECLKILENLNKDSVKENVTKAVQKINEMSSDLQNIDDDIINLHELKKDLL